MLPATPGMTSIRIVYNNDPHEKFKALPHLTTGFRQFSMQGEAVGRDVLRLNSGDNNVGQEPEEWKLNVQMMNLLNYHAVTTGNHEFDAGSLSYAEGLRFANFPTVLSNLRIPSRSPLHQRILDGKLQTGPVISRGRQGTYGIIGITTPELHDVVSSQAKLEGEKVEDWDDTVEEVQEQVNELEAQGINKILLESHMGVELDKRLAQSVSGIDIIISGHSHDELNGIVPGVNYFFTPKGEPVLLVQAGKNGGKFGVLDGQFNAQGHFIPQQNVLVNPFTLPPDPHATAIRNATLGAPKPMATMMNAYDATENDFHADTVAQFTADAVRSATGAEIALVRSPEIRNNFEPGIFTDHDLKALMPFTDPVVRLNVTGQEILNSLNKSAQGLATRNPHPGMLHPSGMAVAMDSQTGRVTQAWVHNRQAGRWDVLNPLKVYDIAIGEYTVKGTEYPDFAHPERVHWNSGQPLRTFFHYGLQQAGAPYRPIAFRDDGRLQISKPAFNPFNPMLNGVPSHPFPVSSPKASQAASVPALAQ